PSEHPGDVLAILGAADQSDHPAPAVVVAGGEQPTVPDHHETRGAAVPERRVLLFADHFERRSPDQRIQDPSSDRTDQPQTQPLPYAPSLMPRHRAAPRRARPPGRRRPEA